MPIETSPNPSNDFLETTVTFPVSVEDLNNLGFPKVSEDWIEDPIGQLRRFEVALIDFSDALTFITDEFNEMRYFFVKVHDVSWGEDPRFYLTFGGPLNKLDSDNLSFRLDQDWSDFKIPGQFPEETRMRLRMHFPYLSGLIIHSLVNPPIIFEQKGIGNIENWVKGYNAEVLHELNKYWFIAADYWGIASMLDDEGKILQYWNAEFPGKFNETGVGYLDWISEELKDPFRPRPKPQW
jgi:hypothetical protein